jgi:hypothetical protein
MALTKVQIINNIVNETGMLQMVGDPGDQITIG